MNRRLHLVCALASFCFLSLPLAAHGAGDPTRGASLYASYGCPACHTRTPTSAIASGASVAVLLHFIETDLGMNNAYSLTLANNPTDLADIAAYIAAATGQQPPATTPNLDQHGLTGSWYEPATSGQGVEVEIYPDRTPGVGYAFVSWFTYDTSTGGADHQRWYTIGGSVTSGQPSAVLSIYQNTGGNFDAAPITNAQVVGSATLSFDTCSSGQLTYAFADGTSRAGTIPLTRLTQNVTCSTTTPYPTNADFALSGNWFDPATSGQGITVDLNPNQKALFMAWYTYIPNGTGVGAMGQRWYTAQAAYTPGARSYALVISETTGGVFDSPTPAGQKTVTVGSGTLAFQSCTAATLSFNFTGGTSAGASGSITLSRVGPVPPGCTS